MNRPEPSPPRIPILLYHSISESPRPVIAPFAVGPAALARHLDLIVAGGYSPVTVSALVAALDGDAPLAPGTVVVTFDDGFEDNLTVAAPLLAERGIPATVFVTSGYLTGRGPAPYPAPGPMLAWNSLGELEAAGLEVGAHSHAHRQLDVLSREELRSDIRRCKYLLEAALGHEVATFAYPHGYASRSVEEEVRGCGFRSACGVGEAVSHTEDNRWHLARLTVRDTTTDDDIRRWLSTAGPVAPRHEAIRTKAWRGARRAGAACGRVTSHIGARPGGGS